MARRACAFCCVFLNLAPIMIPGSAAAEPNYVVNVYESTQYYDIEGSTARELLDEMNSKGPKRPFGPGAAFGQTEWRISWYVQAETSKDACALASADINVELAYMMPRWSGSPRATGKLRKTWEAFLASLWVHEKGHGEIARRGAVAIGEQLMAAPQQSSCDALRESLSAIGEQLITDVIKPAQKKYDKLTKDGQTQRTRL